MFPFSKKKKNTKTKVEDSTTITVECKSCKENGVCEKQTMRKEDLLLRPTGYKGAFQVYVKCDNCGKDIVLSDSQIPRSVMDYLTDRWFVEEEW